jgi:GNAT superfamily N-acetyltransferase
VEVVPATRDRMAAVERLFRTGEPGGCWDAVIRTAPAEDRALVAGWRAEGTPVRIGRRGRFEALTDRPRPPGLLAVDGDDAVGWLSLGPRSDYPRIDRSRATPPVDDLDVWVAACLFVHPEHRRTGVATALLDGAVEAAAAAGVAAVEGYPRGDDDGLTPGSMFVGTVSLFRRAGFDVVREPVPGLPRSYSPRWTVRRATG